jgi:hypothetical protein
VHRLKSLSGAAHFVQVMRRYFRFDKQFLTRRNVAGLLKTGLYLALGHAPVNQIKLQGITESADPTTDTRLFISNDNLARAYKEFMTGAGATNPTRKQTVTKVHKRASASKLSGLEYVKSQAAALAVKPKRRLNFPFYFPTYLAAGSQFVSGTPRLYKVDTLYHAKRSAYRIVVALGPPGEYYGIQGTTWRQPPIVSEPDRVRVVNGRKLLLFYDGPHLRMIAWRTHHGVYWVTNTLDRAISNSRLLAITLSLRHR